MPELKPLLKVQYGAQTTPIPVYEDKSLTNGTMYVHTSNISDGMTVNPVYDAKLYFDLGNKRYHIQGDKLDSLKNLALILGNDPDNTKNITNFNAYNGTIADDLTWVIPYASSTSIGLISKEGIQHFAGAKVFDNEITFDNNLFAKYILPVTNNTYDIGSTTIKWNNIYANYFHGALVGNANTASMAYSTNGTLTFNKAISADFVNNPNNPITISRTFNGSANTEIDIYDFTDENGKLPLSIMPEGALERIFTYNTIVAAQQAILNGDIEPGDLVRTNNDGIMYYVDDIDGGINSTNVSQALKNFIAGRSTEADHVKEILTLRITRGPGQEIQQNEETIIVPNVQQSITYNGGIDQLLDFNVTQEDNYAQGDHIATILGTPIYAGIAWETF